MIHLYLEVLETLSNMNIINGTDSIEKYRKLVTKFGNCLVEELVSLNIKCESSPEFNGTNFFILGKEMIPSEEQKKIIYAHNWKILTECDSCQISFNDVNYYNLKWKLTLNQRIPNFCVQYSTVKFYPLPQDYVELKDFIHEIAYQIYIDVKQKHDEKIIDKMLIEFGLK